MSQVKLARLKKLQGDIDYEFNDLDLLELALTHKSAGSPNNERLEFLGDALLSAIVAEALYQRFDDVPEGVMTTARAQLVRGKTLSEIGFSLQLDKMMILGMGERKENMPVKQSIVGDALEALIGAIYIDHNFSSCQRVVLLLIDSLLNTVSLVPEFKDAKTLLQELMQAEHLALPAYELKKVDGPGHQQYFTVECRVPLNNVSGVGEGYNRRAAEQDAARKVLKQFNYSPGDSSAPEEKKSDG